MFEQQIKYLWDGQKYCVNSEPIKKTNVLLGKSISCCKSYLQWSVHK